MRGLIPPGPVILIEGEGVGEGEGAGEGAGEGEGEREGEGEGEGEGKGEGSIRVQTEGFVRLYGIAIPSLR